MARRGRAITVDDIRRFELDIGAELPADYRSDVDPVPARLAGRVLKLPTD